MAILSYIQSLITIMKNGIDVGYFIYSHHSFKNKKITHYFENYHKHVTIYNDGTGASVLTGGRRFSDSRSTDMFIHMDGQEVFKFAVKSVPTAIETLLHNNNMDINEVDKFILHQANVRIIESVAKRLKADKDKFPVNLNEYGNTSSASIPILLDELNRNGSLKQGEKLVLAGFGAGLSWGSILLVW